MLDEEKQQPEDLAESADSEETVGETAEAVESVESSAEEGAEQSAKEGGEEAAESEEQQAPRRQRRERGGGRGARAAEAALEPPTEPPPPPRLYDQFKNEIIPAMVREFNYSNPMEVPRLQKIVLNIGLGEALTNGRAMEAATRDLTVISGQKPIVTKAKKSIAGFKLR